MLQVFGYAIAVAAALSLVGLAEARLAVMRDMPRRFFWMLAMVLSIAWPLGMLMWNRPAPVAPPEPAAIVQPQDEVITLPEVQIAAVLAGTFQPESAGTAQFDLPSEAPIADRTLLGAWVALSGGLLLYLVMASLLLARRATRWSRAEVLGREVLVSQSTGPALVGVWRPQIVVPRWFLEEPAARQELILKHEEQHVAARDPLVFRAALLIAVALPWNLPLWWQLRRLRQAIELDCDARVLRTGAEADTYGEVLLEVTRRSSDVPVGAVAMGEPASALERRVRSLVPDPARHSAWRAVAALLLWTAGFAAAASLEPPQLPASNSGSAAAQMDAEGKAAAAARAEQIQMELRLKAQHEVRMRAEEQKALQEQRAHEAQQAMKQEKAMREKQLAVMAAQASAPAAPRAAPAAAPAPVPAQDVRPTLDLRDLITMAGSKFKKQFIVDPRVGGQSTWTLSRWIR